MGAEQKNSLACGARLSAETWVDFVARLKHDCVGVGVDDHCTADAFFIVQARVIVAGIDKDYTDQYLVYCEDSKWFTPQEYWDDLGEAERESLNALANDDYSCDFLKANISDQWDMLDDLPEHSVLGWADRWEYVNAHFTKDAAEAFINRKKHDYRDGMRVYVDSQYYAWEFNAIKEAIISGELTYTSPTTEPLEGSAEG
tara:strand:- start:423034 stop:423633 length:600 start_codon:yes stop_codon:yes gene_type:complete